MQECALNSYQMGAFMIIIHSDNLNEKVHYFNGIKKYFTICGKWVSEKEIAKYQSVTCEKCIQKEINNEPLPSWAKE